MTRHAPGVPPYDGSAALMGALAARLCARDAPAKVSPRCDEIGRSVEGRPLLALSQGHGPCTVIVGAIHGDEPASAVAAVRFAEPSDAWPNGLRVVVVPVLNPDGLAAHAKDNGRGVDLNRNFPTKDFGRGARAGYNPGAAPASEPETRALLDLLARERPERVVAIHQPLECVNFDGPARDWARAVAAASGLPVQADIGYPTPGSLGTYLGAERALPILTLELGPGSPEDEWPRAARALSAALGHRAR